jgi:hypothetical protein
MPYRLVITQYHRCKFCDGREWPHFVSCDKDKIRQYGFPCPWHVAEKKLDLVALLIQSEERWEVNEDELPTEDCHVVLPPMREAEEEE